MTVRIERIEGRSVFFRPGDEILTIDSRPVKDQLDLFFRTEGEGCALFTIRRGRRLHSRVLTFGEFARSRPVFEGMRFIRCRSKCIFCFMDQMPKDMRSSLYEKDDDYRLSFLFGNFITLADVGERDITRIIELGLSPLYVSVHAISKQVRERIFARPMKRDILKDLSRLARAGIIFHAQIVLVPGINDGPVMRNTLRRLFALYPYCRSVSIVPVGLTKHRQRLVPLRRITESETRALIDWADHERARFAGLCGGDPFIHLADEFYLATNRMLPAASTYGDFPQLSNGVGTCRHFLKLLEADIKRLRGKPPNRVRMTIVTGTIGAKFMRRYVSPILAEHLPSVSPRVIVVHNRLFGSRVTVSGLLSGGDILRTFEKSRARTGCIVIPANAVNHEGLFLDDLRPADIERELRRPVVVARSTFLESRVIRRCALR
jgi:putative radical SAM enzyme (TIGR03279 family)